MTRPLRIEYENAYYHVMNRGRGRQTIFHSAAYYQLFLKTISEAHNLFGLEVHAYCLMKNHYHLLVKTPLANLSRCMRHINGLYTQRYNRLRKTDGSLFRGRYKSILVDNENYMLNLTRYIHRNPIAVKTEPMSLDCFRWSSYLAYINEVKSPAWLYREETYQLLGHKEKYFYYKQYVENGDDDARLNDFYSADKLKPILGCKKFKELVINKAKYSVQPQEIMKNAVEPPSLSRIIDVVAHQFNIPVEQVMYSKQGYENIPRAIAIYLSRLIGRKSRKEIAQHYDVNNLNSVSYYFYKINKALENNISMRGQVDLLIVDLTP